MRGNFTRLILACGVVLVVGWSASAQAQVRQRSAFDLSRPTLSPYLDYFRRDTGVLPRYQQFVRPRQTQLAERQRTMQDIRSLQMGVQYNAARVTAEGLRGTGRASTYMNFLHFYPQRRR